MVQHEREASARAVATTTPKSWVLKKAARAIYLVILDSDSGDDDSDFGDNDSNSGDDDSDSDSGDNDSEMVQCSSPDHLV